MSARNARNARRGCLLLLLWLAATGALGCGETPASEGHPCPPGGTPLTYENFGKPFLDTRCQGCHGGRPGQREGAPESFDFGTHAAAQQHLERIYARAADDSTSMPPGPDDPPADERARLGEWLGCGAP
jgi:uncharacterized membrane protein